MAPGDTADKGLLNLITALQIGLALTARRAGVTEAVADDLNRIAADMAVMASEAGKTDISSVALVELAKHLTEPIIADIAD